jgi:hypothetical protein
MHRSTLLLLPLLLLLPAVIATTPVATTHTIC